MSQGEHRVAYLKWLILERFEPSSFFDFVFFGGWFSLWFYYCCIFFCEPHTHTQSSIALDLKKEEGLKEMFKLLKDADVLITVNK
jgi:hypothetical protein